ncbi:hypothetical protein MTR_1g072340 [Medicago truncatula]|uniref:Uncharacterized protein n=1 Tax=Medicago truncatula TaxID=3880 RepID=G7IEE0_MEDTR|nr:hypothetical protein MTR_1g072340 [Medicago truncatula]
MSDMHVSALSAEVWRHRQITADGVLVVNYRCDVMVEYTDDDAVETKPIFVDNFGDVKPPKVEVKPNIDEASVHVEASLYVDSGVVPLDAN